MFTPPIVPLAFAFAIGCGLGVLASNGNGCERSDVPCQAWFAGAAVAGLGWIFRQRRRRAVEGGGSVSYRVWIQSTFWTFAACLLLGGGLAAQGIEREVELRDSLRGDGFTPRIVSFRGIVASDPSVPRRRDRLHSFLPLGSDPAVDLRSVSLSIGPGLPVPISGRIRLVLRHGAMPFPIGTRIEGEGLLHGEPFTTNPGGTRSPMATLVGSSAATLVVPDIRLLRVAPEENGGIADVTAVFVGIRASVRGEIRETFRGMIERVESGRRRSLLEALVLGIRRGVGYEGLRQDFAAAGLAHFLAISGFNLAVLAGVAALLARATGVRPRRRGLVVIAAIVGYVAVLPAALPVMRAGASATLLAIGSACGRRWDGRAATALAAIVLLAIAPGEAVRPGFQLSFGVVYALQSIAPRLRRRWFGEPDRLARSRKSVVRSRLADAVAASFSAWAISTPIAAAHFGVVALLGVPATLVATPVVAGIVSLAALSIPLAMISPGVAAIAGWALDLLAGVLVELTDVVERVPGSHRTGMPLGPAVATITTLAIAGWLAAPSGRWCRIARFAMIASLFGAAASLVPEPRDPDRMAATFLDVGDGTSIVVEAGGGVVLVDAGSLDRRTAGGRTVVPALEAMGVRRLDAIVVSHPNLDHFSGLAEVFDAVTVGRLVVGESFMVKVRSRPDGAEASLLSIAQSRGVSVRVIAAGDRISMPDGSTRLECLHPPSMLHGELPRDRPGPNDSSLSLRLTIEGSMRPFLVTLGDLEEAGLRTVSTRVVETAPMVAEVPHHGSLTKETVDLIARAPGTVWVQSTGSRRMRPDRLGGALAEVGSDPRRFVTARDGAVRVVFRGDGEQGLGAVRVDRWHRDRFVPIQRPDQRPDQRPRREPMT